MKQYDSYKDSGVQWIGKIPSHWDVCRLKDHSNIVLGKMLMSTPPKGEEDNYTLEKYLKSKNIGWLNVIDSEDDVEEMWFNEYEKTLYCLKQNDIVMNEGGDVGKIGIWKNTNYICYIQNSVNKITADRLTNPFFLQYLLFAIAKTNYFWSIVNPVSIAHLTKEKLSTTPIVYPPLQEQISIASYLDKKCGEIDKAIATQQKRIDLLVELRQNIITQAVTRGINPDAPLKDSGVEWIGEVPEHWEIKRIKHVINLLTDYDANGSFADIAKNCKVNEGEPYAWMVRATDLENKRYGIVDGNNYCDLSTYKYLAKSSLRANDILIAKRGDIGKTYLVPQCDDPMTLAPNTYLLLTKKDIIDNTFFFSYLQSSGGVENLRILNKSTTLGALYKDDVKAMQIPVPPLSEQEEIVSYIETKTARLDKSIEKAEHQIELLQELKQSIITEVVTGKRKVVA